MTLTQRNTRTRRAAVFWLVAAVAIAGCNDNQNISQADHLAKPATDGTRANNGSTPSPSDTTTSDKAAASSDKAVPARDIQNGEQRPSDSGPEISPAAREEAIAAINKVGGHVTIDEKESGKPVVKLWLQGPATGDDLLVHLSQFPELPWLNVVYFNRVTDVGLANLKYVTKLEDLNLEGTRVTDAGLAPLAKMTKLKRLNLTNTRLTNAGLSYINNLTSLEVLRLSFTEVTDEGVTQLERLKNLKTLALDDTSVTHERVEKLKKVLPNCEVLLNAVQNASADAGVVKPATLTATPDVSASSTGFDWPEWRGPHRDAVCLETGLLQEWPEEGPPLKWIAKNCGSGHSTVAVTGGKVYTTGRRYPEGTVVCAYANNDGKKVWETVIAEGEKETLSTPTVDDKHVYALSREGELVCVTANDGKEVWRRNFLKDFDGSYQSYKNGGGYSESVLIDGDKLICTPGGEKAFLLALNKNTGEVIWEIPVPKNAGPQGTDSAGFSSPVLSNACGIRQYVQMTGRGLIGVAAIDGRTLWTYNGVANRLANVSTPIVRDNYVFASTTHAGHPDSGSALVELLPTSDGIETKEVYRHPERVVANYHGGMVLVGDHIYLGHGYNRGFPLCLEMLTGKIAWRPGRGPGGGSAAVLYADGHIYFRYEDGVVALVEANPKQYVLKAKFKLTLNDREWSHPVIAGKCLYLRGTNLVRCYDLRKPETPPE